MRKPISILSVFIFIFCSASTLFSQDMVQQAKDYILSDKAEFTMSLTEDNLLMVNKHTSQNSGLTHIYFNQTFNRIKIYNAITNVSLDAEGNVFHVGNRFVQHSTKSNSSGTINAVAAVNKVAEHFSQETRNATTIKLPSSDVTQLSVLENANIAASDITAELFYVHQDGELTLTWSIAYEKEDDNFWWDTRVDAITGEIVEKTSWTVECNLGHGENVCDHSEHSHSLKGQTHHSINNATLAADDYRVIAIPNESPSHAGGVTSIVNAPWTNNIDPAANPFTAFPGQSWHHDGNTTHFTTRGNNVWAVEDRNADNNQAAGFSPASQITGAQQYDFTPNFSNQPITYQDAAITNLFYWNNLVHDIMYPYGFNEECGNFQETNATGQGIGSDAVQADAQDGSGTNNATFGTPPDGQNPTMTMFEWTVVTTLFDVTSPFTASLNAVAAGFGPNATFSGTVVEVVDNGGASNEACDVNVPFVNAGALFGNIALLDRGSCNFTEKVQNAEDAGAIAAIVCNNVNTNPFAMGASNPPPPILPTIPSVMISQADCATLRASLPATINVTTFMNVNRDSDYDNGVIVHEYGHGISTRLTGGAANSGCLGGDDQMGEGWSDYFGLILTIKPGDTGPQSRGIGTYLLDEPITGDGIRPFPYSTSFAVNPMTYTSSGGASGTGGTINESIPHGVGTVWATMLWDMTWDLIGIYGIGTDIYDNNIANAGTPGAPGTFGGQNLALQLVIEALKLQPCSPGFVDGRDAILAADQALYNGIHQCLIWEAFARRGLGLSAVQGSSAIRTDNVEAFDVPAIEMFKTASTNLTTDGNTISYDFTVQSCGAETNFNVSDTFDPALTNLTFVTCTDPSAAVTFSGQTMTIAHPGGAGGTTFTCTVSTVVNASGTPSTLFTDDTESGNAGWTINNILGGAAGQWVIANSASNSPSNSWFVSDTNGPDKTTALESPLFNLTATTSLDFFHQFDTEAGWDGGFLEISLDGGASWTKITNAAFCDNGYNGALGASSNPGIVGDAWTGNSGGFIHSIARLGSFGTSPNARVRFVYGQDDNTNNIGWWVDDITIANDKFIEIPNMACVTSDQTTTPVCDDANICVEVAPSTCPGTLSAAISASTNVSCAGGADGSATVTVNGGAAPYTFAWSPTGGTTSTASGLIAGTYTVSVSDANNCTVTATVVISEPATAVSVTASETTAVSCFGDATGVATATASGGTAGYTYQWSSGGNTAVESNLAVGSYTLTATDASGCTAVASVTITGPASTLTVSAAETTAVSCFGDAIGVATASASGGTAGYTYAWSSGGNTAVESNLTAGSHTVTITDANGCVETASVIITEPATALSITTSTSAASCGGNTDGSATVSASGGTPGYTYLWSTGGTLATENNLAAGTVTVTVTDANGCSEIGSATVTEGTLAFVAGSPSATDASCSNASDGTASATATNGTAPYTYAWSNGTTGSTITGLAPGGYTVTATDATGCTLSGTVTVGAGAGISVTASGIDETCAGSSDGSATATASGGSGTYTYSWSSGGTTATETGLIAGTYTVQAIDANTGCMESISVTIGSGTGISVSVTGTNETCTGDSDGTATLSVTGGSGNYGITWSSGGTAATETGLAPGTYTVTVVDQTTGCTDTETVSIAAGISFTINSSSTPADCGSTNGTATASASGPGTYTYAWSNGSVGSTITGLAGGTYTVSVTQSPSGCVITASTTVGVNGGISFTPGFPIGRDESCFGANDGAVGATATGGISPYTFNWEDAAGNALTTISGLAPGTYFVTATDASGCTVSGSATVNSGVMLNWVTGPGAINTTCAGINDGEVFATAGGGTAPYTYDWVDSNGNPINTSGGIGNGSNTGLDNLPPGMYCVTATDANGCTISGCVTVMDGTGLSWTLSPTATGETCFGNANGTVSAIPMGGTAPITTVWTNSAGNQVGTTGLAPGVYNVVSTDANGCTVSGSATVAAGVNEYTMANGNMLIGTQAVTQDYEVDGAIESNQLVTGGSGVNVDYDSGTMITMKPGFEVTLTTVFHAFIDGCGGSMLIDTSSENR